MPSRQHLVFLIIGLFVLAVPSAFAAKGGGGGSTTSAGSSTIQLVMVSSARASTAAKPAYGDQVSYSVSTGRTDRPWTNTRCYQNGVLVLDDWRGMFDGYILSQTFPLGPTQLWTGGAASCTGRLVSFDNGGEKTLATTSFDVAG